MVFKIIKIIKVKIETLIIFIASNSQKTYQLLKVLKLGTVVKCPIITQRID